MRARAVLATGPPALLPAGTERDRVVGSSLRPPALVCQEAGLMEDLGDEARAFLAKLKRIASEGPQP